MNPATTRAPAPTPPTPPPPGNEANHLQAARRRNRIPFWAMATLGLMPVWAFMYVRALTPSSEVAAGPLSAGAEVYNSCANCHGAAGGGANGYKLSGGEVLRTFPRIEDQIRYVYYGTENFRAAGVEIYGNPTRPGGPHITGASGGAMPPFATQLTQTQIISVVCHERYTLGQANPTSDEYAAEYEAWCSDDAPVYAAVDRGEYDFTSPVAEPIEGYELIPVGPEPVPGSAD